MNGSDITPQTSAFSEACTHSCLTEENMRGAATLEPNYGFFLLHETTSWLRMWRLLKICLRPQHPQNSKKKQEAKVTRSIGWLYLGAFSPAVQQLCRHPISRECVTGCRGLGTAVLGLGEEPYHDVYYSSQQGQKKL